MNATAKKTSPLSSSISINPKTLTAILKAVRVFVSKDQTRYTITNVLAETFTDRGIVQFTATDGHTLCSINAPCDVAVEGAPARLSELAIDTLLLCAKGAKGSSAVSIQLDDNPEAGPFPEYTREVPVKLDNEAKGARAHSFDGRYLARIETVQKALGIQGARIQLGETADQPLRADLENDENVKAVVVIMPRRLS